MLTDLKDYNYWIDGMNQNENENWSFSDESTTSLWKKSWEGPARDNDETCVSLKKDKFILKAVNCSNTHRFICEF